MKRAPSELYWNGIRTFGICPDQGASLRDYIKKSLVYSKLHGAGLGKAREEEENTGDDRSAGEVYGFKPLDLRPLNPRRWRSNLDIALSPPEAKFLKDKITSADGSRDSIFAFVLRENHDLKEYAGFDAFAEAMKVLGMVNKYNRGIAKVNRELEKNGNPAAQFDVNKLTEFRVTIRARPESGTIKPESGTIKPESGTIKPESGTINGAQLYNTESQDRAVLDVVRHSPGIKKDAIFLKVKTSSRSVQRSLERLCSDKKIEYRGSKKTGGWYVRT